MAKTILLVISIICSHSMVSARSFVKSYIKTCDCSKDYNPVCGSDRVTYNNDCIAWCNDVDYFTFGECRYLTEKRSKSWIPTKRRESWIPTNPVGIDEWDIENGVLPANYEKKTVNRYSRMVGIPNQNPCGCIYDYFPVCSDNGIEFDNPCFAHCENVNHYSYGECDIVKRRLTKDVQFSTNNEKKTVNRNSRMVGIPNQNPCGCIYDYFPVCSENGIEFDNPCFAHCENVYHYTYGECDSVKSRSTRVVHFSKNKGARKHKPLKRHGLNSHSSDSEIVCACTDFFEPVCGVDDITYANGCMAECKGVPMYLDGPCDQDSGLTIDFDNSE